MTSVGGAKGQPAKKQSLDTPNAPAVYDGNLSDIDLDMDYSDDEDKNYFENDRALLNYLHELEEANLFKIKHLEDSEQTLDRLEQQSTKTIAMHVAKVHEVTKNISDLQENVDRLKARRAYFESKTAKRGADSTAAMIKKQESSLGVVNAETAKIRATYKLKSPLEHFFAEHNPIEEIKHLNDKFRELAQRAKDERYDEAAPKLELLRRVEIKFNALVEWRDNFTNFEQEDKQKNNPNKVAVEEKALKDQRIKERQEANRLDAIRQKEEERDEMERRRKEKEFLLQTLGRREPKRSEKPVKKVEKKKKVEYTDEELMQQKYLGEVYFSSKDAK